VHQQRAGTRRFWRQPDLIAGCLQEGQPHL
jgi:hypothetical protein